MLLNRSVFIEKFALRMIYRFLRIMNPDIFLLTQKKICIQNGGGQAFCDVTGWDQEGEGVKKLQNHLV